ncbi:MAG: NAD(P)/FAD-dependent oxidoreductase [Comamonadaceae bacterium]|nr:NAD(P)/FAD-dependent oxidoreductase [Burkholderiales bacterium]MEB2347121.1 NAD(P)/FAD-dependent oxidoreductase [Comamonadaceae bacterium]
MAKFDAIIVGSGINSLVCAAVMARRGKKVCVLEREAQLGGCIRTDQLTAPGYLHDTMSTAHPLFVTSPGYAELKDALHAAGLAYVNSDAPTGVLLPDGRSFILRTSREENVRAMNALAPGDGDAYRAGLAFVEQNAELIFALLGNELWSSQVGKMMLGRVWKQGAHETLGFFSPALQSARAWLDTRFKSDLVRAVLAPWVLHTGLGPESPMSALMAQVIAFTLEGVGLPLVKGGNARTVDAFKAVIEHGGGELHTGVDVAEILVQGGKAQGVRSADGREWLAKNVVCNVTPTQLYGRLIPRNAAPQTLRQQAAEYRYGKGNMQIHLALSAPPQWKNRELDQVVYLHLTPGLEGVSRAVNEAERGLLPAEGTIVVCTPTTLDPSRAPEDGAVLWIQLPECPRVIRGDALGQIEAPADGLWNEAIRERYADRIIERLATFIPNLKQSIVGRRVISPADLERLNMNLVGGDPYSGECSVDQYMFWRPLRGTKDHATPVKQLWHIGASTHPGPGLGGASGFHVANALAKK